MLHAHLAFFLSLLRSLSGVEIVLGVSSRTILFVSFVVFHFRSPLHATPRMHRCRMPVQCFSSLNSKPVTVVDQDEEPGALKLDKLPTLKPAFKKDGSVTAANASSINDGAAAFVVMSAEKAAALGVQVSEHTHECGKLARCTFGFVWPRCFESSSFQP